MNEPQFLKELEEKRDAAQKEVSEGRLAWEQAQEAIKRFLGWELTGEWREPVLREKYLSENIHIPVTAHQLPLGPHFILRKVEPAPESTPKVDREEAIRKAKEKAEFIRRRMEYTHDFYFDETLQLVEAVEAIPDREPSPLLDKLREFSELKQNWDSYGSPSITPEALRVARLLCGSPKWIAPVPGGGVAVSWDQPDEEPEIEILPSGKLRGDEEEPSPRVVWACPPEVEDKLAAIVYKLEHWAEREQIIELVHQVRDVCCSTREATVEEVSDACLEWFLVKVKNQPPNLTAGEFNRSE